MGSGNNSNLKAFQMKSDAIVNASLADSIYQLWKLTLGVLIFPFLACSYTIYSPIFYTPLSSVKISISSAHSFFSSLDQCSIFSLKGWFPVSPNQVISFLRTETFSQLNNLYASVLLPVKQKYYHHLSHRVVVRIETVST